MIDALLIARHGKLVLEEYFNAIDKNSLHTLRSAGKTLTSILLGAARDHGAPLSPRTRVYEASPVASPATSQSLDPRKQVDDGRAPALP